MKFYELIELGSTLVTSRKHGNTCYCCCVIGTAAAALGVTRPADAKEMYHAIRESVGPAAALDLKCPECHLPAPIYNHVSHDYSEFHPEGAPLLWLADHLHTRHNWERQRIAEFIKPHEDAYADALTNDRHSAESVDKKTVLEYTSPR